MEGMRLMSVALATCLGSEKKIYMHFFLSAPPRMDGRTNENLTVFGLRPKPALWTGNWARAASGPYGALLRAWQVNGGAWLLHRRGLAAAAYPGQNEACSSHLQPSFQLGIFLSGHQVQ